MHWTPEEGDLIASDDAEYKLLEYLDTGGFTTVYRAEVVSSGEEVCIKYPYFGGTNPSIDLFVDREVRALRTIETLGGHPNIMTLHDQFVERGTTFLVVDYVDGDVIEKRTDQFAPAEARKIVLTACSAIARLHASDIIYRDLKEDNVILTPEDRPVLIDLNTCRTVPTCPSCGLAVEHANANGHACNECGTEWDGILQVGDRDRGRYKAPEQRDTERQPGPWTDVYALGRLLFRLVAGFVPPRDFDPGERVDAPEYLTSIVERATNPDPERRYANALALGDALYRRTPTPEPPTATVVDTGTGVKYEISPGDRIGRADATIEPAIPIQDDSPPLVSQDHARFVVDRGRWELLDTGRNGTLVCREQRTHRVLSRSGQRDRSLEMNPAIPARRVLLPGDGIIPVDNRYGKRFRFEGRPWVNV